MAEEYDSEETLLFSKKIGKTDWIGAWTTALGRALYGEPQQTGNLLAGEIFWPSALSFLQCFNYSLQLANRPRSVAPPNPHSSYFKHVLLETGQHGEL